MSILLAALLLLSMSACSCAKQPEETNSTDSNPTDGSNPTNSNPTVVGNGENLTGTMDENIQKLMQANPVEFMGGMMPLDLTDTSEEGLWAVKSYTGLDSTKDITDAAAYEPVTGSQAFSLVMVRVAEGANAKEIARQMKDNIDPRKWICAMADQIMVAGYGDTVMFIMLDSGLGKTAQSYVDAFKTLCGGNLDFTI
jgi:hypothetical protein